MEMNFSYIHGEPDAFYPGSVRARGNRLDRDRLRPDKILAKSKEKEIGQENTTSARIERVRLRG